MAKGVFNKDRTMEGKKGVVNGDSASSSPPPIMTAVVRHATTEDLEEHAAAWKELARTGSGNDAQYSNEKFHNDEENLLDLHPKSRRTLGLLAVFCFLVAIAATVTVAVVLLREEAGQQGEIIGVPKRENNVTTVNNLNTVNSTKRNRYFEELNQVLLLNESNGINAYTSNYHNLAIEWLAYKDNLFMPASSKDLLQRYALLTLIFAFEHVTTIDDWNMTNPNVHQCHAEWWGPSQSTPSHRKTSKTKSITCDDNTNRVVKYFELQEPSQMHGTLPKEIGLLTTLNTLNIDYGGIQGSIPEQLWDLTNLFELRMRGNLFSSTLSTKIGRLSNLEVFDISDNLLTGPLPSELTSLTSIRLFNIITNQVEGPLIELVSPYWASIEELGIRGTKINGIIPASIGNLRKLTSLDLSASNMKGILPDELGKLRNLEYFNAQLGLLTGSIPEDIGSCSKLVFFRIDAPKLTGSIPTTLGRLTNVRYLSAGSNQLWGNIPSELGNMGSLGHLDLSYTQITGTIPSELANNGGLSQIYLHSTELSGTVPKNVCELRQDQLFEFTADCVTEVSCKSTCCTSCF